MAGHVTEQASGPAGNAAVRRRRPITAPYVLLAPAVLFFLAFLAIPVVYALYLSVRGMRVEEGSLFGSRREVFVGLANFGETLSDGGFWTGFARLAAFGMLAIPVTLGLALCFALMLDHTGARGRRLSRAAIFLPYAVPGVIASLLWGFMYLPSTSPFSYLAKQAGLGTIPFLEGSSIYGALANIAVWGGVGFNMLIIYTSLRAIPDEVYDAARIDGCTEWQLAWRIKVPLVIPALILTGLFSLVGTLQVYGEPTTLRPMTTEISADWVPLMHIYDSGFVRDDLPMAAAGSVVLAVGTFLVSLLLLRVAQRRTFGDFT
jgi:multiple sugar transport system permease protein